jgi:hypothetical protein
MAGKIERGVKSPLRSARGGKKVAAKVYSQKSGPARARAEGATRGEITTKRLAPIAATSIAAALTMALVPDQKELSRDSAWGHHTATERIQIVCSNRSVELDSPTEWK